MRGRLVCGATFLKGWCCGSASNSDWRVIDAPMPGVPGRQSAPAHGIKLELHLVWRV